MWRVSYLLLAPARINRCDSTGRFSQSRRLIRVGASRTDSVCITLHWLSLVTLGPHIALVDFVTLNPSLTLTLNPTLTLTQNPTPQIWIQPLTLTPTLTATLYDHPPVTGQTDFSASIAQAKTSGARIFIFFLGGKSAGLLLEQGYNAGLFHEGTQVLTTSTSNLQDLRGKRRGYGRRRRGGGRDYYSDHHMSSLTTYLFRMFCTISLLQRLDQANILTGFLLLLSTFSSHPPLLLSSSLPFLFPSSSSPPPLLLLLLLFLLFLLSFFS